MKLIYQYISLNPRYLKYYFSIKLMPKYFYIFFCTKSSKFHVYFVLTANLNQKPCVDSTVTDKTRT